MFSANLDSFNYIFFKEMFVLLIEEQNRIKLIYQQQIESHLELVQLNLDFKEQIKEKYRDGITDLLKLVFYQKVNEEDIDYFFYFKKTCRKKDKERGELMNLLFNKLESMKKTFYIKKYECKVTNIILSNKNNLPIEKNEHLELALKNLYMIRLIGLKNIGNTSYLNAILQCFINLRPFTNYLLNKNNFFLILDKKEECELLYSYCELLYKLCCDKNIIDYYSPKNFKDILSLKNPVFEGTKENNPKILIYFLFEEMNSELNQIHLEINKNISYINYNLQSKIDDEKKQMNKKLILKDYIDYFISENNNIISKLFISLIEDESICNGCKTKKYNYQIVSSFELPIEVIYNKIYGQQNQNRKLNLLECINNYNESTSFIYVKNK